METGQIEIDFVVNVHTLLVEEDLTSAEKEIEQVVDAIREKQEGGQITVKVILENCYLKNRQIETLCRAAARKGADFVKTSTGYGTYGAKTEEVTLMKDSGKLPVKAAGGIKTFEHAVQMIDAGASRLGTSSSVEIMQGFQPGRIQKEELAGMIDHTNLSANASPKDIEKTCREAVEHGFHSVCVRPDKAGIAAKALKGSQVKLCVVLGFKNLVEKDLGRLSFKRYDVPLEEKKRELEDSLNSIKKEWES
jgi:deoxyribose-phosphate aldolase